MSRWSREKKKTSYLWEMLAHRVHVYGALSAVAAAGFLSIPLGPAALIPVLGYAAATSIAALFIPGSRAFQDAVDARKREEMRSATREHLKAEILRRVGGQHSFWGMYARLLDRRDALRRVAAPDGVITPAEVERLDDATLDFLGLWLGRIAISERSKVLDENALRHRVAAIENDIAATQDAEDLRRLSKAKSDLERLIRRRQEMRSRDAAAEAAMLAMVDTFDEVYQRVMTSPAEGESGRAELRVAVERLDIEEELDHVLYDEVEALLGGKADR